MAARLIGATLLALCWLAGTATGQEAAPRLPRLVFDVDGAAPTRPGDLPGAIRLVVDATEPGDVAARVAATSGWPVWLTVTGADATSVDPAIWPDRIRAIVAAVPTVVAVELHFRQQVGERDEQERPCREGQGKPGE